MIKFLCPSGHPLTAPENLAGKSGKCPKCNVSFVVPRPEDAGDDGNTVAASGSSLSPAMGSGKNLGSASEVFVFLCPNGHKLNGPPSMKGKPGQCPHCGARFLIPTDDDTETENDADEAIDPPGRDQGSSAVARGEGTALDYNHLLGSNISSASGSRRNRPPSGPAGLGFIVAQLWLERTDESDLEIYLNEGEIIAPDYYSETLSTSDYGVFAVREADGTYILSVIPWSTVRRVGLRRLSELPEDMFES